MYNNIEILLSTLYSSDGETNINVSGENVFITTLDGKHFKITAQDFNERKKDISDGIIRISDENSNIEISTRDSSCVSVTKSVGEETHNIEKRTNSTKCNVSSTNGNKVFESAFPFLPTVAPASSDLIKRTILIERLDSAHHSSIGNSRLPIMLNNSALEYLIQNGHISAEKKAKINTKGFVFTKSIVMKNENNDGPVVDVCYVYDEENAFKKGMKQAIVEVGLSNQKLGIKEKERKIIYCLNSEGLYEDINVDLRQFRYPIEAASALNFDVFVEYINELGVSIFPSEQFQEIYANEVVTGHLKEKFNEIIRYMRNLKYTELLEKKAREFYEQELKKQELNGGKSI